MRDPHPKTFWSNVGETWSHVGDSARSATRPWLERVRGKSAAWGGTPLGRRLGGLFGRGRGRWIAALGLVVALGIVLLVASRPDESTSRPVYFQVEESDITIRISERGELRALDSVTISAQKDLPIIFLAPEGDLVAEGDLVVQFDPGKYEVALEESRSLLMVAEADLKRAERQLESQELKLQAELARFDAEVQIAELEIAELNRKPLREDLERATNQLASAKLAFENAENKRNLMPNLVTKGFVTKSALQESELAYLEAKTDLSNAQSNFDQVSAGATPHEMQRAQIRRDQARVALEKAQAGMLSELDSFQALVDRETANVRRANDLIREAELKLARTTLFAPRAGIVVYAPAGDGSGEKIQLGMIPYDGQPVVFLPDLSTMVVDAEVNEIDIGKVREDGPVDVRLEAYPGVTFGGKVLEIGSLAKLKTSASGASSGIKAFDVTVQIEGNDPRLKPGLTAHLDIVVTEQEDVLSVPLQAVTSRNGEHVVYVAKSGGLEERKVVLGASDEHIVVVENGLQPGERILLNHSAS